MRRRGFTLIELLIVIAIIGIIAISAKEAWDVRDRKASKESKKQEMAKQFVTCSDEVNRDYRNTEERMAAFATTHRADVTACMFRAGFTDFDPRDFGL